MSQPPRSVWVHVKATPDERLTWQQVAEANGLTVADLIRQRLDAPVVGTLPKPKRRPPKSPADPALLAELAKIGNNLNQLARWANTHKSAAESAQVLIHLAAIERHLSFLLPGGVGGGAPDQSHADQVA